MARKDCWRVAAVCLVLGLGTVALYSPAFHFGFVNYDDQMYVTANGHVNRGLTAEGVRWAFQAGYAGNWHPMTWLSHIMDCQVFGPKAGGHHGTSVLLHALNSMLLFLVLRRMTGALWRSAAVGAFFAWHPLHVESVAWIAERKDVLSAFFWMLAMWAYVRYVEESKAPSPKARIYYLGTLVWFTLGLMSKPMVVTLPCVLLLLDWWPLGRWQSGQAAAGGEGEGPAGPGKLQLLTEKIPFFVLSVGASIVTLVAVHREGAASAVARLPFKIRFVTAGVSYFRYLEKTVWPSDLGAMYPFVIHYPKWELICIALVLAGISAVAWQVRKARPFWLVGWLWYAGMLFPVMNLVAAGGQPMADRYMYLPSIGLLVLICWDAYDLAGRWRMGRVILGGLCGVGLAACCVTTSNQLQYWRNEGTLLSRVTQPETNFLGHANYAAYLMNHNQLKQAQAECDKAVSIVPKYGLVQGLLGNILMLEGKYDDAIATLRSAQRLDPSLAAIHVPLGRALLGKKRLEEAAGEFRLAIETEPRNYEAHDWLGRTLLAEGKTADGVAEFHKSLALQPNQVEVLNNLAWMLATNPRGELRNGAEAVQLARRACELTRDTQFIFLGTLAAAYAEAGRFDEAAATAQKAADLAAKEGNKAAASRNLELLQIYRSRQAFHQKP
ncbi:MAG: tetratricopeptide repeat protein [Verrucomicrobiota bacterium]|jgi:Flp pilus assembly protein TadD